MFSDILSSEQIHFFRGSKIIKSRWEISVVFYFFLSLLPSNPCKRQIVFADYFILISNLPLKAEFWLQRNSIFSHADSFLGQYVKRFHFSPDPINALPITSLDLSLVFHFTIYLKYPDLYMMYHMQTLLTS